MADTVTYENIQKAREVVYNDPWIVRTPLLSHVQDMFPSLDQDIDLYLKLENMQTTGSFKYRGVVHQMECLPNKVLDGRSTAVVASCGNYGKAFAYCMSKRGLKGKVVMPDTASQHRINTIKSFGIDVENVPFKNIQKHIDSCVAKGHTLLRSFAAPNVTAYGSIVFEILGLVPDPDVVVVSCGGAGLAAGVSAAIKLAGHTNCRVYAVSPIGAPTLYESMKRGRAVEMPNVKTKATGLMPLFIDDFPYQICKRYLDDVLLVSDEEIIESLQLLNERGLKVELSGTAGFTALVQGRIKDVKGKKVVVVITGGNITAAELAQLID